MSFKFLKLKNTRNKGVTLIEMILYFGLLSIFLVVLTEIFASILEVRTESEATSAVEQDGRFLIARFAFDLKQASSISIPPNLGDSSNSLSVIIGGDNYTYTLSGGNFQLSNSFGINNLNSSETQIFAPSSGSIFTRIGNPVGKDTIRIQFTLRSLTQRKQGPEERTFQTTIGRR